MLQMQTKQNGGGEPAAFVISQHDSAEFNSTNGELMNLVTDQGGSLTPTVDFLTEDQHEINRAVIAAGGFIMPTSSVTGTFAAFTAAVAGQENFPAKTQFTNKFLRFKTANVPNSGSYLIDYDGDINSLLDIEENNLNYGSLPANSIVEVYWDGATWVLNGILNPESGGYIYGNSGVIKSGDEISDFDTANSNFQLGKKGMLSGEDEGGTWFGHNTYSQLGSSEDSYDKIVDSEWCGRFNFDEANGRMSYQFALDGDPNNDFDFRESFGVSNVGDHFLGESANINNVSGDANWLYEWMEDDRVRAVSKPASSQYSLFEGTNVYPSGPFTTINIINTGDWSFSLQDESGTFFFSGNGIGGSGFSLSATMPERNAHFDNEQSSFRNPVGLGRILNTDFLNSDSLVVQHRLGEYSSLQNAVNNGQDTIYDAIGHGMRTENILGSAIESSFNALPDTIDAAFCLTYHIDGSVFGIGTTGLNAQSHVAKKPLIGTVSQIDVAVDLGVPFTATNNATGDILFLAESSNSTVAQILKSIDSGVTWTVSFSSLSGDHITGMTRLRDGTIVAVKYGSSFGGTNATAVYSTDDGDTWSVGTPISGLANGNLGDGGGNFFQFVEHSDGTIFFAGRGTLTEQYIKIFSASSIDGVFSEVGEVGPNTNGTPPYGCTYIDPLTDAIYVGMQDDGDNNLIRKSVDKGITFSTVYSQLGGVSTSTVLKIISTPEGNLYAITKYDNFSSQILRSTNGGDTWGIIIQDGLYKDLIYNPNDASLYMIKSNSAGGIGYIIETIDVEEDIATLDNSDPIKMRMYQGNFDVYNSIETYEEGDRINFGSPNLRVNRNYISTLNNPLAPSLLGDIPNGSFFRNSKDQNRLWMKDVDGEGTPVNGGFSITEISANDMVPISPTAGSLQIVELGGGSDVAAYKVINFPDTGSDLYCAEIPTPKSWYSGKVKFRINYTIMDAISLPGTVGWTLAIRPLRDTGFASTFWSTIDVEQDLVNAIVDRWRQTEFVLSADISPIEPGDILGIQITRDNGVTNNEDGDVQLFSIDIQWVAD